MEKKLRFGVIAGSLRKQSFSRALGNCLESLAPANITIEQLPSIGDLPLFNQDILDETGAPAALTELAERTAAVDGVIIISPEYNWSIPGALKNALDWLSRLNPNPLAEKPVTLFTCSPGLLGGARAHPPIRNVLHALDCRILARPEVQITQIKGKMAPDLSAVTDPATAEFITQRLSAFGAFAQRG